MGKSTLLQTGGHFILSPGFRLTKAKEKSNVPTTVSFKVAEVLLFHPQFIQKKLLFHPQFQWSEIIWNGSEMIYEKDRKPWYHWLYRPKPLEIKEPRHFGLSPEKWWRWRESNSRPKAFPQKFLRVQPMVGHSPSSMPIGRPTGRLSRKSLMLPGFHTRFSCMVVARHQACRWTWADGRAALRSHCELIICLFSVYFNVPFLTQTEQTATRLSWFYTPVETRNIPTSLFISHFSLLRSSFPALRSGF